MRSWPCLVAVFVVSCGSKHPDLDQLPWDEKVSRAVPIGPDGSLGTLGNPVRAAGPFGEREFLARLRCPDSAVAQHERLGSRSGTADEHMVDTYIVDCAPSGPTYRVIMDMYHPGHREKASIGPLMVLDELPAKMAKGCPPQTSSDPDSSATYVYSQFEVDQPAYLLEDEPPASKVGIGGRAWVSFVVDTAGAPEPATLVLQHVEPESLRPHVPAALRGLRFQPAVHHPGCLVRQQVEGPLSFE
jgi:hypothetical protein